MASTFNLFRGDTVPIDVAVTVAGVATSIAGATLFFTLREYTGAPDVLVELLTGAGIVHTDDAGGLATITIPAASTADLPVEADMPYDVQLKTAAGEIYTVASGTLYFAQDQTLRTA